MYVGQEKQISFNSGWFEVPPLDEKHLLVKIAKVINWDSLLKNLSKYYHASFGRPTKPSRVKVGLLIIKHMYKLSDRETVDELKSDMYVQYLCDINPRDAHTFINYSTLCRFRKDIGIDGVKIIEQEVFECLKKLGLIKGRRSKQLIVDTTVVPSPIQYPTDINLLNKCRTKLVGLIDKAKQLGSKGYRTYKRLGRKTFIQYQKLRMVSKTIRRKTQKKLIQFVRRNIKQLADTVTTVSQSAHNQKDSFIKQANELLNKTNKILNQQINLYKGNPVKDRIVSLWAGHVRPMVKGKFPIAVEFGAKTLLSKIGKFLFCNNIFFDNTADVNMLQESINDFKSTFEKPPSEIATDRGFYSKANIEFAKNAGIKNVAIAKKGTSKSMDYCNKTAYKRLCSLRCAIEAKISLAKRKFGLDKVNYRIKNGEEMWIRLGLLAMNLKSALV